MHKKSLISAMVLMAIIAVAGSQTQVYAVDRCGGIYSPGNPYECFKDGNCVWWTWHWLRWGKGDRSVPFRVSALQWDDVAQQNGYVVDNNPEVGAIAVNETSQLNGKVYGHVAVVVGFNNSTLYVDEMHYGLPNLRQRKPYSRSWFTKFIHPKVQPKLFSITPQPFYSPYDAPYGLSGENLDKVTKLEVIFPSGVKGYLSGSQIPRNSTFLQMWITLGTPGKWSVNAITDQNVESYPIFFDVQKR